MSRNKKILFLTRIAVFIAIMLIMEFTGLGYIKTPTGLELTIMPVPVIIGAIVMGPLAGAILGGVFGVTSFLQCFGKSPFGVALFAINPWYTAILCIPTRILTGYLCGLIFKKLSQRKTVPNISNQDGAKKSGKTIWAYGIAGISGAFMNTLFFMTALIVLFGRTEFIMNIRGNQNLFTFLITFVGVQGVIEALVCFWCGTVIARVLNPIMNKK